MSTGNLKLDILLNKINEDANQCSPDALQVICASFPSLNPIDARKLYALVSASAQCKHKAPSLVITAPPSFGIRAKSTKNTVETLLREAKRSMLITGYSLSDYFDGLIDCIVEKSQCGIMVRFFVNHLETQSNVEKLCRYKGHYLKIYNYPKGKDKMSALHAKVISVDNEKTLVTSANLSYHGQEGNIELGTLVESKQFAVGVSEIFTKLLFSKVFIEIKD